MNVECLKTDYDYEKFFKEFTCCENKDDVIKVIVLEKGAEELGKKMSHGIYRAGIKALSHFYPDLSNYISSTVNGWSGSGWSLEPCYSYGITFKGIKFIVQEMKINAIVAESLEELKDALSKIPLGKSSAIITAKHLLSGSDSNNMIHAVSLFVRHTEEGIELFDNDSLGNPDHEYAGLDSILEGKTKRIYASTQKRQENSYPTCQSFAINDCIIYQNNTNILQDVSKKYKEDKGKIIHINKMPAPISTFDNEASARFALECQHLIIQHIRQQ